MLYSTAFKAMGCQINLWLDTEEDGTAILSRTPAWVEAYEAILSRFRPMSELSQLNQHIGQPVEVSDTLLTTIRAAVHAAAITEGLYNPLILQALIAAGYDRNFEQIQSTRFSTKGMSVAEWRDLRIEEQTVVLPAPLDLGGVAKGWIAEQIAQRLSLYGTCLVDAGGDLVARGTWTVGVFNPLTQADVVSVRLTDAAIATSGIDYRRWGHHQHHLIHPQTGRPAETDVLTATVIHLRAVKAEAFAKTLILRGGEAGLQWLGIHDPTAAALVICKDGSLLSTPNFKEFIQ